MRSRSFVWLLACVACGSSGYRIQALPPAMLSADGCPHGSAKLHLEPVEDLRRQDDPARIGSVNNATPLLLEPLPKITLGAEIDNALANCNVLVGRAEMVYALRITLADWAVEENASSTSEEMVVRLKYTATLTPRTGGRVAFREISAEARKSAPNVTNFAPELNREALKQSVEKLLRFIREESARRSTDGA